MRRIRERDLLKLLNYLIAEQFPPIQIILIVFPPVQRRIKLKEFFPTGKMNWHFSFRPKLFEALKNYSAQKFSLDLTAGLTVGIVALPLAMALAIASGLKPEVGIFTAIIAGILISTLGGSRVQIGDQLAHSCRCLPQLFWYTA